MDKGNDGDEIAWKMADLYWREYTYRNDLMWHHIYRFVFFQSALVLAPLIFIREAKSGLPFVVPLISLIVAFIITYIGFGAVKSEVKKMRIPSNLYRYTINSRMPPDHSEYYIINRNMPILTPHEDIGSGLFDRHGVNLKAILLEISDGKSAPSNWYPEQIALFGGACCIAHVIYMLVF